MSKPAKSSAQWSRGWQIVFDTELKNPAAAESARTVVNARADPRKLNLCLAAISLGAQLSKRRDLIALRKRAQRLRKVEKARLARLPRQLRATARKIAETNDDLRLDPRRLLSSPPPDTTLQERVMSRKANQFLEDLIAQWTALPKVLLWYAAYLDLCVQREKPEPRRRRDEFYRRNCVELVRYVFSSTKHDFYDELAVLVTAALKRGGLNKTFTADTLRKLADRNLSLLDSKKPFV